MLTSKNGYARPFLALVLTFYQYGCILLFLGKTSSIKGVSEKNWSHQIKQIVTHAP